MTRTIRDVDFHVFYTKLRPTVTEAIIPNPDGSYTIAISTQVTQEHQSEDFWHAVEHVLNTDFNKSSVQQIDLQPGLSI